MTVNLRGVVGVYEHVLVSCIGMVLQGRDFEVALPSFFYTLTAWVLMTLSLVLVEMFISRLLVFVSPGDIQRCKSFAFFFASITLS